MARDTGTGKETSGPKEEARKLIGQAIIDGLLSPVGGVVAIPLDYTQGEGGYWQDSGNHIQSKGDYHQAVKFLPE